MKTLHRALALSAAVLLVAACSAGASPTPITAGDPVAAVLAQDPQFAGLMPLDPNMIGQSGYYEVQRAADGGYAVRVWIGWGDCPSGCINHHKWQFHVDPDGTISLIDESGDEPVAVNPVGEQRPANVVVHMRAGPTCPAEPVPPQPGCEPRPVANANLIVRDAQATELATATSDEQGQVVLRLPAGAYYVEPQPVEGLLGTAAPVAFSVVGGDSLDINVDYDTGIR